MSKKVTQEEVLKALAVLDSELGDEETTTIKKASEDDLDQPEGADISPSKDHMKNKMSDEAPDAEAKKPVKKAAKSDDGDEDDEDEGEESDEGDEMMEKKQKGIKKSFNEDMPQEIETKIDVSEFLKSLVTHTGETIDALSEYVVKSEKGNAARYEELSDAVKEIQKSQSKIGLVLKAICEEIGVVKAAPAGKIKSETVAKSTAVAERKFDSGLASEAGEAEEKMFKSLSNDPIVAKSQLSETLCDLVKGGHASDMDVITFESSGYIRPELIGKLKEKLN